MAFLGAGAVASLVGVAGEAVSAVIKKYLPDPTAQAQMQLEVYKALQQSDLAQMEVNKSEAANASVFVSGWRPAIGWVGAFCIFYIYVGYSFTLMVCGMAWPDHTTMLLNVLPKIDNSIIELVAALLGLGGLRSFEKYQGVTK